MASWKRSHPSDGQANNTFFADPKHCDCFGLSYHLFLPNAQALPFVEPSIHCRPVLAVLPTTADAIVVRSCAHPPIAFGENQGTTDIVIRGSFSTSSSP